MWIFWALLSAVLVASRRPIEKKVIRELHHFTYGFLVQCVSLPILLVIVILSGNLLNPLELSVGFWLPVLAVSMGYYPLNSYLYKHAVKDGELSNVLPLQSLWPVFGLLLAWLTLGEVPGLLATAGVLATVLGVYALGLKGKKLHHPLQPFKEDASSRAMLASVLLVTVVSILDKAAIRGSNPLFYSLATSTGALVTLSVAMRMSKLKITTSLKPVMGRMGIIGTLQGTTYITYLLAVAAGPIAYVSALRSTNILLGSILGLIIFKEKLTLAKAIAFLLIIVGAVLLACGSS